MAWDGAAFDVGMAAGQTIVRVNGRPFSLDVLREAVAHPGAGLVHLEMAGRASGSDVDIHYADGLRYPWLERDPTVPDRLTAFLEPRGPQAS